MISYDTKHATIKNEAVCKIVVSKIIIEKRTWLAIDSQHFSFKIGAGIIRNTCISVKY